MKIDITKVTPIYPRAVFVQWVVTPTAGVSGVYKFRVQRSGSPAGPWTDASPELIDAINYTESFQGADSKTDEANLLSSDREMYYRVRVLGPDNQVLYSPPMDLHGILAEDTRQTRPLNPLERRRLLLRRKILRDEAVALRALNGVELVVLKRRHYGVRCSQCYDRLTRATTLSNCPVCFGTSWEGGYYTPIRVWGRIQPSAMNTSVSNTGPSEVNSTQITLLNYPTVEDDDVLVEVAGGRRWLVKSVNTTELRRVPVHQRVLAVEIPRDANVYNIDV